MYLFWGYTPGCCFLVGCLLMYVQCCKFSFLSFFMEKMELKSEIQNIKQAIKRVESLASVRTHLILRVELVRKAKSQEDLEGSISYYKFWYFVSQLVSSGSYQLISVLMFCFDFGPVLISKTKSAACVLQMGDEAVPYDGIGVDSVLSTYRQQFISAAHKKDTKKVSSKLVPTNRAKNLPSGRTRKGTLYLRKWDNFELWIPPFLCIFFDSIVIYEVIQSIH